MNLREMTARRAAVAGEMRTLNDQPAGDGGDLSTEQRTRWDGLRLELTGLDDRISRQTLVDDADRRAAGTPIGTGDRHLDQVAGQVGILDVIRAQMGSTDAAAGRARAVSAELARRSGRQPQGLLWSMRTPPVETRTTTSGAQGTTNVGGSLIATTLRPDLFIDILRSATVLRGLGARVLADLVGNVDAPRRTGSVTASWVAENTAISFSDQAFDHVSLRPKHVGAITELSRNMVLQSSPDVETLTRDDMAQVLARAIDAGGLFGTGANSQPLGVLNTPNVAAITAGDTLWPDVLACIAAVQSANVMLDSPGFVATPAFVRAAQLQEKITGVAAGLVIDQPGRLAGYPLAVTTSLPQTTTTTLLFGNWSDLLIGIWSELDILVNPYAESSYQKGNIQVRAMATVDVAVRHPQSFAVVAAETLP